MKQGGHALARVLISGTVAVACLLFIRPVARAQEFQSWNEVDFTASLGHVDLLSPLVSRVDPNLSNPQLIATGLTADIRLPWSLTLTAGDLLADLPQASYVVQIPLIAVTTTLHHGRLTLADRNRFEELIGYPGSPVRYRNRVLLDWRIGGNDRGHAFVDDELFVNLSTASFNQNRFQMGVGAHLSRDLLIDLYYLQKTTSSGSQTFVLGSTLKVKLARHPKSGVLTRSP